MNPFARQTDIYCFLLFAKALISVAIILIQDNKKQPTISALPTTDIDNYEHPKKAGLNLTSMHYIYAFMQEINLLINSFLTSNSSKTFFIGTLHFLI